MSLTSRVEFIVLAVLGSLTLLALAAKYRRRTKGLAWWYLTLATWVGLLIDALFLVAVLGLVTGPLGAHLFVWFLGARILLQGWLLWMVLRDKQ